MTLKQIAEQAGVSISTVSRVLSGSSSISEAVSKKVLMIARETGYLDKQKGSRGVRREFGSRKVLLVTPKKFLSQSEANYASFTLIDTLRQACRNEELELSSFLSEDDTVSPELLREYLLEHPVDGILMVWDDNPELIRMVAGSGLPAVLINGEDRSMRVDTVAPNNRYAAYAAVNYLIEQGHRDIVLMTYPGRMTIDLREAGFKDSLIDSKLKVKKDNIIYANGFRMEDGEEAISRWLDEGNNKATAIFCVTDSLAIGALKTLKERGFTVPDDMSVMGMDDLLPVDMLNPPLTTVRMPFRELPLQAIKMLREQMNADEPRTYHLHTELSCEIVARGTVRSF